ncbi:MAG: methyl-accepting chemotaxis protein [Desulfobacteraceae bacterium]|jgi:methyl-accepting chemotaxis protein|nr:methyl-accepting chemotaxis protein [Desulfobacteraceae bacterium]
MFRSISKSIMAKLIVQFFIVGLIPLIGMGTLTYYLSKDAMETEVFNHIASVNSIQKVQVLEFLKNRVKNLTLLSRTQHIRSMLHNKTYQEMSSIFEYYMNVFGYSDIILLNENGETLYSAAKNLEYDIGSDVKVETDVVTKGLWGKIIKTEIPTMTDIVKYKNDIAPALFMGAPVFADTGEMSAVLICQINATRINALISERTGMGESRDTYLVGPDLLMRSSSRFLENDAILKQTVNTRSAGTKRVKDYRGIDVLSAYSHLQLPAKIGADFEWAIITQVDESEAFALLNTLEMNIYWGTAMLFFLVGIVGFFQSKMIAKPINELSYRIVMLNDGDLTAEVPLTHPNRSDEIGLLLKTFNDGSKKFRKQMTSILDSTNLLVASISRLSTTASQLATSASETSSSISEVTTTAEEVKQTSQVASEKADYVAKSADSTTRISYAGKQATENTMIGIDRIREEMNHIAESTVQLSGQTKSIEDIINTVSDIADQSNILSVNAAIEAAKAGEHGKGFAVVAQEVKTLANQSKNATNQVRDILGDIQKATATAVMATERGTKTVAEAVELSEQAGNAIDRLSARVTESAEAAMQITASNQQQLSGMDQLSQAMENINDATQQNLEGVKHLEDAIKGLEEMAHTLTSVTSSYKI